MKTTSLTLGLGLGLLLSAGCYRYVPTRIEATPPGSEVRVLVTEAGSTELAEVIALNGQATRVDGRLLERIDDDLVLSVDVARRQDGFQTTMLTQRVRVPAAEVVSFERRELNGLTTAVAVTGVVGVVGGLIAVVGKSLQGDGPGDSEPPDEFTFRIPLLSIRLGR